ncbi:MAG: hypothetical protein IIB00_06880 [candidate division Zixibacteria bacterium]|nr:hypothetical protein [candidate division Zixibacteria bacterium]
MITIAPAEIVTFTLEYLESRFGIDSSVFSKAKFYLGSRSRLYMINESVEVAQFAVTAGLLVARVPRFVKPSTNFLQAFESSITKSKLQLDKTQAQKYISGEDLTLDSNTEETPENGYVAVFYGAYCLGCGFLKNSVLKNVLPKEKRLNLKFL